MLLTSHLIKKIFVRLVEYGFDNASDKLFGKRGFL